MPSANPPLIRTRVIVSNDSDLLLPIQWVRGKFHKQVGILNPHKPPAKSLRLNTDWMWPLRQGPISAAQFPESLTDARGPFHKPSTW